MFEIYGLMPEEQGRWLHVEEIGEPDREQARAVATDAAKRWLMAQPTGTKVRAYENDRRITNHAQSEVMGVEWVRTLDGIEKLEIGIQHPIVTWRPGDGVRVPRCWVAMGDAISAGDERSPQAAIEAWRKAWRDARERGER